MAETTFIYGLRDPRDGRIYYVGKSDDPEQRKYQHLQDTKTNKGRVDWIAGLRAAGLEPELVILDEVSVDDWGEAERDWIAQGLDSGWPLLNIKAGGICDPDPEDFEFMYSYVARDLWDAFDDLSTDDKNEVCLQTGQAMAKTYLPWLKHKMETGQRGMRQMIHDECYQVGMRAATQVVKLLTQRS